MVRLLLGALAAIVLAWPALARAESGPELPGTPAAESYRPGALLVKFKSNVRQWERVEALADLDATEQARTSNTAIRRLAVPAGSELEKLSQLRSDPRVQYAELDHIVTAAWTPSDPYYAQQWGMPQIGAPEAWDVAQGAGVTVAVIDTGVDLTHPDLVDNLVAGKGWVGNCTNECPTNDDNGHGTHVSGIVAARANDVGVLGVAPLANIMPLKALDGNGFGSYSDLALAIDYAVVHGADVINMSLGGTAYSEALEEVVTEAWNGGVLLVAAAGNNYGSTTIYPAGFSNVMAVAATTITDTRASFSNYGSHVSVSAPGQSIYSTWKDGGYRSDFGTSMAAPMVSGLAALVFSNQSQDNAIVRQIIEDSADDIDGANPSYAGLLGSGRINAARAVYWVRAAFSSSPVTGTIPLSVTFTNESLGDYSSTLWDFGDGITSTVTSPSHSYEAAGPYTVTLTVGGVANSDALTRTSYLTAYTPVHAGFSANPVTGTIPLTIIFVNESSGDYSSTLWAFGDGGTSADPDPSHTYSSAGSYTVTLSASGPGGTETITKTHFISAYAPVVADFSASPITGTIPLSVTFTNESLGDYASTLWDFGDSITSSTISPNHTYEAAGQYTVTLTIGGIANSDALTRTSYITAYESVHAGFSASPVTGTIPLTTTFVNESFGDYSSTSWAFGDGGTSADPNPSHTYAAAGFYTVTLTASGPGGAETISKTRFITTYTPVVVGFSASPITGTIPLTVTFADESSGDFSSRLWDFGDGDTSTETSPIHTYDSAGSYTVILTFSELGGTETITMTRFITAYTPVLAAFSASPLTGTVPLTVTFANESSGEDLTFSWDFGDGAVSTSASPTHTYVEGGQRSVTLTVSGPGGFDSVSLPDIVVAYAPIEGRFTANPLSGSLPLVVTFTNESVGMYTGSRWDFGDGASSDSLNPTHTYTSAGTYTVTLTPSNSLGDGLPAVCVECVTVHQPVLADFSAAPLAGTVPVTVTFANLSSGDFVSSLWDFGDGQTSSLSNPTHVYTTIGAHDVTLIIEGPGGTSTKTRSAYIVTDNWQYRQGIAGMGKNLLSPAVDRDLSTNAFWWDQLLSLLGLL